MEKGKGLDEVKLKIVNAFYFMRHRDSIIRAERAEYEARLAAQRKDREEALKIRLLSRRKAKPNVAAYMVRSTTYDPVRVSLRQVAKPILESIPTMLEVSSLQKRPSYVVRPEDCATPAEIEKMEIEEPSPPPKKKWWAKKAGA
jgi:hypothetical protein